MKVFNIKSPYDAGQLHSVVANSIADAEQVFLTKYPSTKIERIELHSEYVQIQTFDRSPKGLQSKNLDDLELEYEHETNKFCTYQCQDCGHYTHKFVQWLAERIM